MSAEKVLGQLKVPAEKSSAGLSADFLDSVTRGLPLAPKRRERLRKDFAAALSALLGRAGSLWREEVEISVRRGERRLAVELRNKGNPIFAGEGWATDGSFRNLGREGQALLLEAELPPAKPAAARVAAPDGEPELRLIRPEEYPGLSRLFYAAYGYRYINERVYYPEQLSRMAAEGRLESLVAVLPDGRIAGHVGILEWNRSPRVVELALGVVDPTVKAQGIFSRLFHEAFARSRRAPRHYAFYDLVTNHDYSQRLVARYGSHEIALFVGNQVRETQARLEPLGLGADPKEMDRYSVLLSLDPGVPHPFGERITLPTHLSEIAESVLRPLGIAWVPAPRFQPLASGGRYEAERQEPQRSVIFDLVEPGRQALAGLLADWEHRLQEGYQYAAVVVPVDRPGLGQARDILAEKGFFMAGFVPYRNSARLGFRFQALAPARVGFDEIRVYSPKARELLALVRADYERNRIL